VSPAFVIGSLAGNAVGNALRRNNAGPAAPRPPWSSAGSPAGSGRAEAQCQSLIWTSRGAGAPAPVSSSDFRDIR